MNYCEMIAMESVKKTKELLIIMPAYNEEENIGKVLEDLYKLPIMEIADVLVLNDASRDGTEAVVKRSPANVVTHVYNLGYGSALQLGYKYACKHGYQYVIQMDADGQHDICNVETIYESLRTKDANGKYPDMVLGSRFLTDKGDIYVSPIKKVAMKLFSTWIRLLTGKTILDPTTGLQGLNHRVFSYYSRYTNFDDKYPDANMILQMLLLGFRVEEVPGIMHQRVMGVSMHSGLKPILYMIRMFFSMMAVWVRVKVLKIDVGVANEVV